MKGVLGSGKSKFLLKRKNVTAVVRYWRPGAGVPGRTSPWWWQSSTPCAGSASRRWTPGCRCDPPRPSAWCTACARSSATKCPAPPRACRTPQFLRVTFHTDSSWLFQAKFERKKTQKPVMTFHHDVFRHLLNALSLGMHSHFTSQVRQSAQTWPVPVAQASSLRFPRRRWRRRHHHHYGGGEKRRAYE